MLSDIQLQVPLRVYSRNGELIGEFGEKKRIPLQFDAFPDLLVKAVLAAEDDRFYEHPGIDYQGLLRAAYQLIKTGEKGQGGSTITMQVARNFFLSKEKTFLRKFNEILLSLKIEKELTKNNILELYLNKIYLGKRSYGMAAAAQVYYGKDINDLSIAEMAMLAGLPKAPSAYNPIVNPDRAKLRRDYVLKRMYTLGMITQEQYNHEKEAAVTAKQHSVDVELPAPFIAEMVRSYMVDLYGDNAYTNGYHVFTTVDPKSQRAASAAVIKNLLEYDYRHGYRGAESHIELTGDETPDTLKKHLNNYPSVGPLQAALVIAIADKEADVITKEGQIIKLPWSSFEWARSYIDHNTQGDLPVTVTDVVNIGDIIRIDNSNEVLKVSQLPTVGGALVSINANNGQLIALVGGFDFYFSKFNRVTQALRQPGSNLKPFIYSAALANGYNPASLINDAPVVFDDDKLESEWRPENYSGKIYGPTRLREALVRSRNLVSIRLLQSIGISTAIKHLEKFGFNKNQLPHDLSLALGSASVTPYQLIQGYAVIANGGYMIEPHFISQILDDNGQLVSNPSFQIACSQCDVLDSNISPTPGFDKAPMDNDNLLELRKLRLASRQVDERNIFLIQNIMQDVIKQGTGRKARSLGRKDLAGKTGTTNEQHDAWFSGYNSNIVATAWIGFDNPRPLGNRETGAGAALPMWIDYMRYALEGEPERSMVQPSKMVSVRIDSLTGKYTTANNPKAIFEIFREENAPQPEPDQIIHNRGTNTNSIDETITEELF
jgi:penicillin-binding protein 1A